MIPLQKRISKQYLDQQLAMHAAPRGYGAKGARWAPTVLAVRAHYGAWCSILDYGCGQGSLGRALAAAGAVCREYDPAIAGKDAPPVFADIVVCTDVLEHVEPERLTDVLTHLCQLARKAVFVVVSTRLANKTLPDGRNAHLIVQPAEWWCERVTAVGFTVKPAPISPTPMKMPGKAWVAVLEP